MNTETQRLCRKPEFINMVKGIAKCNGKRITQASIREALKKVENGEAIVTSYPSGLPSIKGLTRLARKIMKEQQHPLAKEVLWQRKKTESEKGL